MECPGGVLVKVLVGAEVQRSAMWFLSFWPFMRTTMFEGLFPWLVGLRTSTLRMTHERNQRNLCAGKKREQMHTNVANATSARKPRETKKRERRVPTDLCHESQHILAILELLTKLSASGVHHAHRFVKGSGLVLLSSVCKDNTSKDPFSRCEICKNLGYRLS